MSSSLSPRMKELCDKLRNNDPGVREVDADDRHGDARHLWKALCGNTQVETLRLDVDELSESDLGNESTAPLLQFLRESSTLGKVTLYARGRQYSDLRQDLAKQCLLAVARNSGTNVKTLVLQIENGYKVPTTAFATLIGKTKSIQTLVVSECDFQDVATTEELGALHAAVLQNNSIREIDLCLAHSTVVSEALFTSLGHHGCLQSLKLVTPESKTSQMQPLASLLSSTKTLEKLTLSLPFEDKELMDVLVEGLKANETLIELAFPYYATFSVDAMQSLTEYMQSPKLGHSMRELYLCPWDFDVDENFGASVVSMLATPMVDHERHLKSPIRTSDKVGSPTVGSSLQLLELAHAGPDRSFYRTFAAHAARIHLHSLKINLLTGRDYDSFHALLPKLIHLREFFAPSDGYADPAAFVRALKTNGSLSNVTIAVANHDLSHDALKRLIKAYCERNATLPALLSNSQGVEDSGDGPLGDKPSGAGDTGLSQLPTLFVAAQQASATAPKLVLTGLFSAGERLTQRSSGKSDNKRVLSE